MSLTLCLIASFAAVVAFIILVPVVMFKIEKSDKIDLDSLLSERDRRLRVGGR
jgi:hypothetical protein